MRFSYPHFTVPAFSLIVVSCYLSSSINYAARLTDLDAFAAARFRLRSVDSIYPAYPSSSHFCQRNRRANLLHDSRLLFATLLSRLRHSPYLFRFRKLRIPQRPS